MNEKQAQLWTVLENMAQYGIPDPQSIHLVDIGTGSYLEYFKKEVLDDLVSRGGATCRFFEGAYGAGKSHLLHLLKSIALDRGMVVADIDLSKGLKLEDWRQITLTILETMEMRIDGVIYRSLPEIISAWSRLRNIDSELLRKESLPHPGYFNGMVWATQMDSLLQPAWSLLTTFLNGGKVKVSELKAHGLKGVKAPLTQRNAELVLKTVLYFIHKLGIPGTMLLFDENEKTFTVIKNNPTTKQMVAANLMRRIIDGCCNGLLTGTTAVFAVLPGFLQTCASVYPALGQRLQIIPGMNTPAWRVPVLPVTLINELQDPHSFMLEAVHSFMNHAQTLELRTDGLEESLLVVGKYVIDNNVGSGYKRELMKALASRLLNGVEGVTV